MVHVQLLGGVTANSDAGAALEIGPAKCQAVLAALALSVGDPVTVSRLIDVLWGEDPPATADKTLQGYIARLRKNLGAEAIIRAGSAYRLDLEADRVDVARFRRLITSGDVDGALVAWTGTPWSGVHVPGLAAASDGLIEQWLGAIEDQLQRRVVTDPAGAIAPLAELTAAHPFREELWVLLMAALYRVGRQADALAAFQRVREHLIGELGVEPGPRLRELERRILDHDPELVNGPESAATDALPGPGERVSVAPTGTVTFGFVRVSDATRLWEEHLRKMSLAIARLDAVLRSVAEEFAGTMLFAAGESFGVAFHRAGDAAGWAARLQLAVEQEPWPGGIDVRLTVALHTGEAIEHDGAYFGPAVHTASRLAAAGHPGQILVSAVTAAVLERHDLRDLGTHRLEGVVADHEIRQLGDGDHPPLRTSRVVSGNLPRRPRQLLGRDDELDRVGEAMRQSPVVTLIGPGGIGKTSLAIAAAHRSQADEQRRIWLIDLATITDPDDVPRATAETLGITGGDGRTRTESIVAALRARPSLLVLDNCEHVIAGAARLAHAVAADGGDTRVLATSREGLGVAGEQLIVVPPLDTEAAVELFARRAGAVSPTLDLSADHVQVAAICRRLDGLPLAIELAAARTTTLAAGELLDRLDDRLRLLDGGQRTSPQRHRNLRTTVQWSYDLLSTDQQRAFEQLAVFAGPFDLAAAEAVAAHTDQDRVVTDQLLGDLVERSMMTVEPGPFGRRFRLLETLRQFADDQLTAHGRRSDVAQRHARWCRDEVAQIGAMLNGRGEVEGVARLAELWPNLRLAVDWACSTRDRILADSLVRPIAVEVNLRRQSEIGDWAERILDLIDPADEASVVFWLLWAGHRRAQAGDHAAWEALLERHGHRDHPVIRFNTAYLAATAEAAKASSPVAVAWLRDHDDDHAADLVEIAGVATSLMTSHRFAELATFAASLAARHRDGPPTLHYFALGMQGYAAQYQGRSDDATRYFTDATALELPDGTYRVIQTVEARMAFVRGDRTRAYRILTDHIDDLLGQDHTDVTRMVAVEYITMMSAISRLADAAHILGYLDTTGDFAKLARENLIVDTVRRIEAEPDPMAAAEQTLDAHHALLHMRDGLEELLRCGNV